MLATGLGELWTRDGRIPQGCPLSVMFIVALYLPWCRYLAAHEGCCSLVILFFGRRVKWVAFSGSLHWPVGGADLGVGGISNVELLILCELWAGERLVLEKAHPRYLRPGLPISVSAVPFGPGIDIWRSCRFIGVMMRSLCTLPGGLGRFVPCSVGANHCRLRHLAWERCRHGLTSRPQESASGPFLDQLLLLFHYPPRSSGALLAGSLPSRYCSPQGCPLSMMFIVALYLPWCRYLSAHEVIQRQLYADNLKCVSRDPDLLLSAARFTTGYIRLVGQEPAPSNCVLLSTSRVVRKDMEDWELSQEGDEWSVKVDVRDLGGHLDTTFRGWSATLAARVRLVISRLVLIFALRLDFLGRVRLVRSMFLPAALHGIEASLVASYSLRKLQSSIHRVV